MSHDKLAYMANQIGRFFQSQKTETAVDSIEDHLRKYWDPRMRQSIMAQLAKGSIELDPPVRAAVERLQAHTDAHVMAGEGPPSKPLAEQPPQIE